MDNEQPLDLACYRCGQDARSPDGTIFVRRKIDGRGQNAPICEEHWFEENPGRRPLKLTAPEYRSPPVCDFCGERPIVWAYPTESFALPEYEWGSEGDWAACEPCSALIEASSWEALQERTLARYQTNGADPYLLDTMRSWVRQCQADFRKHRTGPRVPYEEPACAPTPPPSPAGPSSSGC
jgi:hypothetical protein